MAWTRRSSRTAEQLGMILGVLAHRTQRRRIAVADVDEEAVADEHLDLAELDLLYRVEVAGGLERPEDRLVVELELGISCALRRLDREQMELEIGDLVELGLGRLEEADQMNDRPSRSAGHTRRPAARPAGAAVFMTGGRRRSPPVPRRTAPEPRPSSPAADPDREIHEMVPWPRRRPGLRRIAG